MNPSHYETLLAICQGRRSTRDFADRPLSPEVIQQILDVALTAPYASGKRNWEIVVVTDPEQRQRMVEAVRQRAGHEAAGQAERFGGEQGQHADTGDRFDVVVAFPLPRLLVGLRVHQRQRGGDAVGRDENGRRR